jgi:hypothetical protein
MERRSVSGVALYFDAEERETAEFVGAACEQSVALIRGQWGLELQGECRLYVMTSWFHFFLHSAPWHWKILLVTVPLWTFQARRTWPFASGWTQVFGQRRVVGVKPARLLPEPGQGAGSRLFVQEEDPNEYVRRTTCHELVHAFTAHLKLPNWLHEGLATVASDGIAGKPTVQDATLESLSRPSREVIPRERRQVSVRDPETLIYHAIRGYWVTRFLEETKPGLLRSLLAQRYGHEELEDKVARAFGMEREEFWRSIDGLVVSHFAGNSAQPQRDITPENVASLAGAVP